MALIKAIFLLVVAYSQVYADDIPADYVENVVATGSRIVSGWEAKPGQFPHHAALRMINAAGAMSGCGASVVHREWLVSAAHCTAMQVTIIVRAGVVNIHTPEYIGDAQRWFNYPTFDDSNPRLVQPNDIALIKLINPVTYSPLLQAIRIVSKTDAFRDYNRVVMEASGHGMLWTNGVQPEILNWVYLHAISNSICQLTYGANLINQNAICTQGYNVTSQSVCSGDSGGPLMYTGADGERVLVGVASFVAGGDWGCHSGLPAGFVRTGPFVGWFEEISGIDFTNLNEEETTTPPPTTTTETPTTTTETPTTTTETPTTTTETPTTPEPEEVEEEGDSSEEDSDEELADLLKRLEVKVKVKVRMNKYGKRIEHKHKHKFHV